MERQVFRLPFKKSEWSKQPFAADKNCPIVELYFMKIIKFCNELNFYENVFKKYQRRHLFLKYNIQKPNAVWGKI
ncbi:MAG: hypothetical protein A2096_15720 [Spirochaetes bacterium GWF1_41_5]|nr:MAG: hypothetical protein A2096_15720 [Spirochaetes bacterium GWF1_41_5]HBE04764.1 hypothetical protein [Spirochaetia bacterium]